MTNEWFDGVFFLMDSRERDGQCGTCIGTAMTEDECRELTQTRWANSGALWVEAKTGRHRYDLSPDMPPDIVNLYATQSGRTPPFDPTPLHDSQRSGRPRNRQEWFDRAAMLGFMALCYGGAVYFTARKGVRSLRRRMRR